MYFSNIVLCERQGLTSMWDCWKQVDVLTGRSHSPAASESVGVWLWSWHMYAYTHSPLITHTNTHTHTFPGCSSVEKLVKRGVFWALHCPCKGNRAVWRSRREFACLTVELYAPSLRYYPFAANSFDVFILWTAGWVIEELNHKLLAEHLLKLFSEGQTKCCKRSILLLWCERPRFAVTKHPDPVTLAETDHTHLTDTLLHHVSQG